MRKANRMVVTIAAAGLISLVALPSAVSAEDASAQAAYKDIEQTLGSVPSFFKLFPEAAPSPALQAWDG
jgi:hypothetical protein